MARKRNFFKFLIIFTFALFLLCASSLAALFAFGVLEDFSDVENLLPDTGANGKKNSANKFDNSSQPVSSSFSSDYDILPSSSSSDHYMRNYSWEYDGYRQSFSLAIPKEYYDFYRSKPHTGKNLDFYALSENDRQFLGQMIEGFKEQGRRNNFSDDQVVLNVIAFVQSMPYTSDSVTTGYDEYPRYPIETLVDGGGDCEDSSILAMALLSEMGYDTVLIGVSNHIALGVKSNGDLPGKYYEHNGDKYYYVETTNSGHGFGEIPPAYKYLEAEIFVMNPMPFIFVTVQSELVDYDRNYAQFKVFCNVTNYGPTTAKNVSISIFAEESPYDLNHLLSSEMNVSVGTILDDASWKTEQILKIPRNCSACFSCIVSGDNFDSVAVQTNVINID